MKFAVLEHRHAVAVLVALLVVLTFLIYEPGLYGGFIFDDKLNVEQNANVRLTTLSWQEIANTWNSGVASSVGRPLAMLSFGLNYYFSGMNPLAFKVTNVVIHLVATIGIYLLARELLTLGLKPATGDERRVRLLAVFIAACWALHPLNVSPVLYIVQRMTLLAAVPVIYALVLYCRFRRNDAATPRQALLTFGLILLLLLAGTLAKENAVLLVLFMLSVEAFLLRFQAPSDGQRLFLRLYVSMLLVLPAIGAIVLLAIAPDAILGSYSVRSFSLVERLMTEARVIWVYLYWLVLPDTRQFTFHHDNFPVSHGLLDPASTLLSIAALAGLAVLVWKLRVRAPLVAFGVAFFFAGHVLESSIVALELVFEHRNYLPGFGIMLALIVALRSLPSAILNQRTAAFVLAFYLAFLAQGTFVKSMEWSNEHQQLISAVRINPDSHRINYELGYLYLNVAEATPDKAATLEAASDYFRRAAALDPQASRAHVGFILTESQLGKPIDTEIARDLAYRWRNYALDRNAFVEASMLTECWYGGFCRFDKATLISFYNAIAANTVSDPVLPQGILDQVGTAIADVFGNKEDARAILYLARSTRDELTVVDLKLIRLEAETGNTAAARDLLRDARARSSSAAWLQRLDALATELDLR
ncbi:MAG: hypothetical protein ACO1PZ_17455 [Gammaproteobacteria bacterium]